MRVGIDASNIVSGGGLNHLIELLDAVSPDIHGISSITLWSNQNTLDRVKSKNFLIKKNHDFLNRGLLKRWVWQKYILEKELRNQCDILYVPGGSYSGRFRPFVTMNRNLLPFDLSVRKKYGLSLHTSRLFLLEKIQSKTYQSSSGVIFLSKNAQRVTENTVGQEIKNSTIIPHGISEHFLDNPRKARPLSEITSESPFKITYTSTITVYKHQWNVIEAVYLLRKSGIPVVLDLIGGVTTKIGRKLLEDAIAKYDPEQNFVRIHGKTSQDKIREHYKKSDLFLFASSCETFGQILLEGMASGLPVACSKRSAMPEILKDAGIYFDPESAGSIKEALDQMIHSHELRNELAAKSRELAEDYSWEKCANQTFGFIAKTYKRHSVE